MDFQKQIILENTHVLLRPVELSDFDHFLDFSLNEPEIWKYSLVTAAGTENLKKYVEASVKARKEAKEYPFIVFDKKLNRYAGCTRFYDIQTANGSLHLGYTWYGKDFRGTLLNKHCKFLLLDYAFNVLNMERVEFRADNQNERSIAAMKSIGCTVEGVLRSNVPKPGGGRRDSIVLSILRDEWKEKLKAQLQQKLQ